MIYTNNHQTEPWLRKNQAFTAKLGLTPTLLCRVLRFQQARMLVGRTAKPDWENLAAC
jgi:hypothetical protein